MKDETDIKHSLSEKDKKRGRESVLISEPAEGLLMTDSNDTTEWAKINLSTLR